MTDTAIDLSFADGKYRFWLPMPQALELERKCGGKSIFAMYDQIGAGLGLDGDKAVYIGGGSAMITDIREIIRLALIGGNACIVDGEEKPVGPMTAKQLVDDYVYPARPLTESAHIAWSILHAAITGIQLKKKAGQGGRKSRSPSAKAKSSATAG